MVSKEMVGPRQFSFDMEGVQPSVISLHVPYAEFLATHIQSDKLWLESIKVKYGILINWHEESNEQYVFDAKTFKTKPNIEKNKYAVVAVLTPAIHEMTEEISGKFIGLGTKLGKDGRFYVIEEKSEHSDIETRKHVLQEIGLVDTSVLVSNKDVYIWRGRLPKKRKGVEKDLIKGWEKEDPNHMLRFIGIAKDKNQENYAKMGFTVLNTESIDARLRASINPHFDIQVLKNGGGVRIQSSDCLCEWDVDLLGDIKNVQTGTGCEEHHVGQLYKYHDEIIPAQKNDTISETVHKKHMFGHTVLLDQTCGCGKHLIEESREDEKMDNGKIRIIVEIKCPEHGLIFGWGKKKIIKEDQFIR